MAIFVIEYPSKGQHLRPRLPQLLSLENQAFARKAVAP
jgi:hypothetical protein